MAQIAFLRRAGPELSAAPSCRHPEPSSLPLVTESLAPCCSDRLPPPNQGCNLVDSRLFHVVKPFDLFVWFGLVFRSTAEIISYWQRGHLELHYISFTSLAQRSQTENWKVYGRLLERPQFWPKQNKLKLMDSFCFLTRGAIHHKVLWPHWGVPSVSSGIWW